MVNQVTNQPTKTAPGIFYGYIIVAAALVMWITAWGTYQTFGIFFEPMADDLGWTRITVSGAASLSAVMCAIFGAINGKLCDKFGPRIIMPIGGAFLGISYLLMSQLSDIWNIYLFWGLLSAIGLSVVGPALMSTVSRWFVKRRGLMIAIVSTGAGIGGMIFAPASAWLVLSHGWRNGWLIIGVIALIAMVASGSVLKRDSPAVSNLTNGAKEIEKPEENKQNTAVRAKGLALSEALRTRQFWILSVVLLFFGLNRGIMVHIAPHITDLGFSLTTAGSVLAVNSGVSIAGRLLMGQLSDMIGGRYSFIISFILFPAAFLALLLFREVWALYLWAVLFGLAWGGIAVLRFSIASELFGTVSLGAIMGIVEIFATAGSGITPTIAGWLYDITRNYQLTFSILVATGVFGLSISWLLKPVVRKRELKI